MKETDGKDPGKEPGGAEGAKEPGGAEGAAAAYAQWLEGCERMTQAWLRMTPHPEAWMEMMPRTAQGRAFTDAVRGMMDAAGAAGWPPAAGATPPGDQGGGADPFAQWRAELRDLAMRSWSTMMTNAVNTPGYAEAMGTMLGTSAAAAEPFEKAVESTMSRTLHRMNMPTRADITKLLERLTHIEKRLDDLAAER